MTEENEFMLIIKTKTDQIDELKKSIIKNHPYEVPEFICLPVNKNFSFQVIEFFRLNKEASHI